MASNIIPTPVGAFSPFQIAPIDPSIHLIQAAMEIVQENIIDAMTSDTKRCNICNGPIQKISEGQLLPTDECAISVHETLQFARILCKKMGGKTLVPDNIKQNNIDSNTPYNISDNIIKTANPFLQHEINKEKHLLINLDLPGYSPFSIKVSLHKPNNNEYRIDISCNNSIKGDKLISFNISSSRYNPEQMTITVKDGLMNINIPPTPIYIIKQIPINTTISELLVQPTIVPNKE